MTNDDSRAAKAAGLKTLAAQALLSRFRQQSAFEIAFEARCDRLQAVRAALEDRNALSPELVNELHWRHAEALLAVATVPSRTKAELARKLGVIGPINGDWLASIDQTLVGIAAASAMCADARALGAAVTIEVSGNGKPPSPSSVN